MITELIWEAKCPFCKRRTSIRISAQGYEKWIKGESVQKAFPRLDSTDRELLISGICPPCQKKVFSECEEDEDCYDEDDGSDDCYTLEDLGPNWW